MKFIIRVAIPSYVGAANPLSQVRVSIPGRRERDGDPGTKVFIAPLLGFLVFS